MQHLGDTHCKTSTLLSRNLVVLTWKVQGCCCLTAGWTRSASRCVQQVEQQTPVTQTPFKRLQCKQQRCRRVNKPETAPGAVCWMRLARVSEQFDWMFGWVSLSAHVESISQTQTGAWLVLSGLWLQSPGAERVIRAFGVCSLGLITIVRWNSKTPECFL